MAQIVEADSSKAQGLAGGLQVVLVQTCRAQA